MNKNIIKAFLLVASLLIFIIYLVNIPNNSSVQQSQPYKKISVILYGDTAERWNTLEQGVRKASGEQGYEETIVKMSDEINNKEQIDLIQREIENGAEGLLIAASDSTLIRESLSQFPLDIPIVTIETGIDDNFPYVGADNYSLGYNLAQNVCDDNPNNIIIIKDHTQKKSVNDRFLGFCDFLDQNNILYETWIPEENVSTFEFLKQNFEQIEQSSIIALDNSTLDQLLNVYIDCQDSLSKTNDTKITNKIYGIGISDKIISYLDKGMITTLGFQNEFNIGYLGVMKISGQQKILEKNVSTLLITKQNMYDPDIERLLFPIIQ